MSKANVKLEGTPEVHSARSKLDGVLQILVEKNDEDEFISTTPVKEFTCKQETDNDSSPLSTPTKKTFSNKISRKRKRGKEESVSPEVSQGPQSFVMRFFDRSVDMAQFDEDSSLYAICRAWMKNQPNSRYTVRRSESPPRVAIRTSPEEVYSLPSPVPLKCENGGPIPGRVPSPLPPSNQRFDITRDHCNMSPEQLLLSHMSRWKQVRQKFRDAAKIREARYAPSLKILKDMYDKHCKN